MRSSRRSGNRHRLIQNDATPSRRPRNPAPQTTPGTQLQRLNGLFTNGTWYCNCNPRDEAKLLKVKKETKNKDRLFWGCSRPPNDRRKCDFFMWEDDPRARNGGHDDPLPTVDVDAPPPPPVEQTTPSKGQPGTIRPDATQIPTPSTKASTAKKAKTRSIREFFKSTTEEQAGTSSEEEDGAQRNAADPGARLPPSSSDTMVPETPTAGSKRKRVEFHEDLIGDMSSDEERLMEEAMERSTRKLQQTDTTPLDSVATTPAVQRTGAASGAATPTTARTLFPEAKRARFEGPGAAVSADSAAPGSSPQQGDDAGIVDEVMNLLKGQPLEEYTRKAVIQALNRQADRLRGAVKGRDAVRTQIKAKDVRIAELQERVAALENKAKMQRQELTEIKAGLANLYSKH